MRKDLKNIQLSIEISTTMGYTGQQKAVSRYRSTPLFAAGEPKR